MLSVEKCREILGVDQEISDEEIEVLQVIMRSFMNLIFDEEIDGVKQ